MSEQAIVRLIRRENAIVAFIGSDFQNGIAGWGDTVSEALRDLAAAIQHDQYPLPDLEPKPKLIRVK